MTTGSDTLLVASPEVRDRMKALNGTPLPRWADIAEVTDVELKEASQIRLVTQNGEHALKQELLNRAREQGKFGPDDLTVDTVELMERKIEALHQSAADKQRKEDERALRWKRAVRTADEVLAAEDTATDAAPDIVSLGAEMDLDLPEVQWVVHDLVHVGGRTVVGGFRKAGKTIFVLNLAIARARGSLFLDRFETQPLPEGRTVGWLNCELTRIVARKWVHQMGMWTHPTDLDRIIAAHLRGAVSQFAVTTRTGEEALYRFLCEHQVDTLLVDPVGPLMNVCGLDVNDGRDVGRFLTTMDRIAHRAETPQLIYTAHVGKTSSQDEGNETVMGATRWEDSVDSIIILGKERVSGTRWIRAEGREVSLDNATLIFDSEAKKLTLDPYSSRYDVELLELAKQVLEVVRASPGILAGPLAGDLRIVGTKGKRLAGIQKAVDLGWIEVHAGHGTSKPYWPRV